MSAISPKAVAVEFSRSWRPGSPGDNRWAKTPDPTTIATRRAVPTASATAPRASASVVAFGDASSTAIAALPFRPGHGPCPAGGRWPSATRPPGGAGVGSAAGEVDELLAELMEGLGPEPV